MQTPSSCASRNFYYNSRNNVGNGITNYQSVFRLNNSNQSCNNGATGGPGQQQQPVVVGVPAQQSQQQPGPLAVSSDRLLDAEANNNLNNGSSDKLHYEIRFNLNAIPPQKLTQ